MLQVGNIKKIFDKIQAAGTPPKFTYDFLSSTLGFKGSGDRGIIKLMRAMGFLTADGTPTARYNSFRSSLEGKRVLADGLREAYAPVFLADTSANDRTSAELTEIFKRVSAKGEAVAQKMASTFKTIAVLADWSTESLGSKDDENVDPGELKGAPNFDLKEPSRSRLSLHQDVHLHLPTSSDVSVYTAIFRALKDELLD